MTKQTLFKGTTIFIIKISRFAKGLVNLASPTNRLGGYPSIKVIHSLVNFSTILYCIYDSVPVFRKFADSCVHTQLLLFCMSSQGTNEKGIPIILAVNSSLETKSFFDNSFKERFPIDLSLNLS